LPRLFEEKQFRFTLEEEHSYVRHLTCHTSAAQLLEYSAIAWWSERSIVASFDSALILGVIHRMLVCAPEGGTRSAPNPRTCREKLTSVR
jgi:hypothetical protein